MRQPREISRLLRDNNIVTLANSTLRFHQELEPDEAIEAELEGIAPFHCSYLAGGPSSSHLSIDDWDIIENTLKAAGFPFFDEEAYLLFRDHIDDLQFFTVKADNVALHRSNLGGDLFLVLDGSLRLQDKDARLCIGKHQFLGELEIGDDEGFETRFPYSVTASKDSRLLRIPAALVSTWLSSGKTGVALFSNLKQKVRIRDLYHFPTTKNKRSSPIQAGSTLIKIHEIQAVCRALLALSLEEAKDNKRDPRGNRVFYDYELLKSLTNKSDPQRVNEPLWILSAIGVIDNFRLEFSTGNLEYIVGSALNKYLSDKSAMNNIVAYILEGKETFSTTTKRSVTTRLNTIRAFFKDYHEDFYHDNVNLFLKFLDNVFTKAVGEYPSFVILRDKAALYSILKANAAEASNLLQDRALAIIKSNIIENDRDYWKVKTSSRENYLNLT